MKSCLIIFSLFISLASTLQAQNPVREVLHKHANGRDKMVVWYLPATREIVKEEVYFENGLLDFSGTYKDNLEHGTWKFYWPNGLLKSEGLYEKGVEEGIHRSWDEKGKLISEQRYLHGRLLQ